MADILLAEFAGRVWLVRGDEHFDGLLRNELSPTVVCEFAQCASHDEVLALRLEHGDPEDDGDEPWLLNPAIVRRIKGRPKEQAVMFPAWSAMPDAAAQVTIDDVTAGLRSSLAARLVLRQFSPAAPPAGLADLQRLRGTLLAGALERAGADAAALDHETHTSEAPADVDRIDLVTVAVTTD